VSSSSSNLKTKTIFICGISGAGCTTALNALEDFNFFTVGKLPVGLIEDLIVTRQAKDPLTKIAILPEIKSKEDLSEFLEIKRKLGKDHSETIFIDALDNTIVKRYSETRRPHPDFAGPKDNTLINAIKRERKHLIQIKEISSLIIDTTSLTVHDLKREISKYVEKHYLVENKIRVNLVSFGFKNGLPLDCDLIVDVRFIPNPYFVPELKEKTGLTPEVSKWILAQEDTQKFISLYLELLKFLIPKYAYEGKAYLNIGVGCTGGKHRSVAIVEALAGLIKLPNDKVTCYHKDLPA